MAGQHVSSSRSGRPQHSDLSVDKDDLSVDNDDLSVDNDNLSIDKDVFAALTVWLRNTISEMAVHAPMPLALHWPADW